MWKAVYPYLIAIGIGLVASLVHSFVTDQDKPEPKAKPKATSQEEQE